MPLFKDLYVRKKKKKKEYFLYSLFQGLLYTNCIAVHNLVI